MMNRMLGFLSCAAAGGVPATVAASAIGIAAASSRFDKTFIYVLRPWIDQLGFGTGASSRRAGALAALGDRVVKLGVERVGERLPLLGRSLGHIGAPAGPAAAPSSRPAWFPHRRQAPRPQPGDTRSSRQPLLLTPKRRFSFRFTSRPSFKSGIRCDLRAAIHRVRTLCREKGCGNTPERPRASRRASCQSSDRTAQTACRHRQS